MAASDAFYQEIVAEVETVLAELGKSFTIRSPGAYDDVTLTTAPPTTRSALGLVADQQTAVQFGGAGALGGRGGEEDMLNLVATKNLVLSASAAPKSDEEVEVDGKWYPLSKAVEVKPADVVVVYILDVTK